MQAKKVRVLVKLREWRKLILVYRLVVIFKRTVNMLVDLLNLICKYL